MWTFMAEQRELTLTHITKLTKDSALMRLSESFSIAATVPQAGLLV